MLQIPVPLIFLDIAISAQANSWSSALNATADMSMQMSYYNEALKLVFIRDEMEGNPGTVNYTHKISEEDFLIRVEVISEEKNTSEFQTVRTSRISGNQLGSKIVESRIDK